MAEPERNSPAGRGPSTSLGETASPSAARPSGASAAPASAARSSAGKRRPPAGARLRRAWSRLSPLPGGRWLFSKAVGFMAPYTGSIGARVVELEPGFCRVAMRQRRRLGNPFGSIHAVALLNLAEEASGLATLFALPDDARGIVTALAIDFEKKARGTITATCRTDPPRVAPAEPVGHVAHVELHDAAGERVATARATWTIAGPG